MTQRKGDWLQTYTGKAFWPLDPRPDDIDIVDIAHALSNQCRYNGHCTSFYSVAQHSVIVSMHVDPENALWGLMHDAAEAYVCDVPRPLKPVLSGYKDIENGVMSAICDKFGLPQEQPQEVKRIDTAILADEKDALMVKEPRDWGLAYDAIGCTIEPWPQEIAKEYFLSRFKEITQ